MNSFNTANSRPDQAPESAQAMAEDGGRFSAENKDGGDCPTHPTVGVETIGDINCEEMGPQALPESSPECHIGEETKDYEGKDFKEAEDFCEVISNFNSNLQKRRQEILGRKEEIKQEIETLKIVEQIPQDFGNYALAQISVREQVLRNCGESETNIENSTKKAANSIKNFLCKREELSQEKQHEKVFTTEKTNGFKMEQNTSQYSNDRKRDQKYLEKQNQDFSTDFGQYAQAPQAVMNGYQDQSLLEIQPGELLGAAPNQFGGNSEFDHVTMDLNNQQMHISGLEDTNIHHPDKRQKLGEFDTPGQISEKALVKQEPIDLGDSNLDHNPSDSLFDDFNGLKTESNLLADLEDTKLDYFLENCSQPDKSSEALDGEDKNTKNIQHGSQQTDYNENLDYIPNQPQPLLTSPYPIYPHSSPHLDPHYLLPTYDPNTPNLPPIDLNPPQYLPFNIGNPLLKQDTPFNGLIKQENPPPGATKPPKTKGKRNKYKMIPTEMKKKAVKLAMTKGPKFAASFYKVAAKSLKRWIKVGCERKKGGGRKTKDPKMEGELFQWYCAQRAMGVPVTAKMVKDRAIEIKNCEDFIASKGWLDKFKIRFRLEISKETNRESYKRGGVRNVEAAMRKRGRNSAAAPPTSGMTQPRTADFRVRRSINKSIYPEDGFDTESDKINQEQNKIHVLPEGKSWNHQNTNIKGDGNGEINYEERRPAHTGQVFPNSATNDQFDTQGMDDSGNNKITTQWGTIPANPQNLPNTDN